MSEPFGLPVLTYHAIGPERTPLATDPARFADTLAALLAAGYRAVDLHDWVARGRPDEPRGFALAFDDGLRSVLRAAEAVARFGVCATVFLVTGRVGSESAWPGQPRWAPVEPTLSWADIADLLPCGFRFASHGASHAPMNRLDPARLLDELRGSRATIEDRTGRPCRLLAYPYGFAPPAARRAAAGEYEAAFGTALGYARGSDDPFDLGRVDAYYLRRPRALRALIEGRAGGWLRRRQALRQARARAESLLAPSGRSKVVFFPASSAACATRPRLAARGEPRPASGAVVCPACRGPLEALGGKSFACRACPREFPAVAGVPDLRLESDRYLSLESDRAKAARLAEAATRPGADVDAVAQAYYAMTDDVLDHRRGRFLRHIAGAEARGAALAAALPRTGVTLEVGCGTGGLLVAAARTGRAVVGVDIASRWLVVARRRLQDRGLSVPVVAAGAERLPWPDATFDAVAADSLLEHLDDPAAALREWRRVVRPGGALVLWSPNRFSLTTDPHLNLWGVGWLPRRLVRPYLRSRGRSEWPPRTHSATEARRLARACGWETVTVGPPDIPDGWAASRPPRERALIRAYRLARGVTGARWLLGRVGPLWELRAGRAA